MICVERRCVIISARPHGPPGPRSPRRSPGRALPAPAAFGLLGRESELRSEHLQGTAIPALQARPAPAALAEPGAAVGAGLGSSTGQYPTGTANSPEEEGSLAGWGSQLPNTSC